MKKLIWCLFFLLPLHLSATWLHQYRGEASPGQLADSLGSANLVMTGTVSNPSTPTPLDGLLWLAGGFGSDSNYFTLPGSVIPTGGTGQVSWYMNCVNGGAEANEAWWIINNGSNFTTLGTRYFELNCLEISATTFKITGDYTDSSGGNNHLDSGAGTIFTAGNTYTVIVKWDAGGVNVFVNGSSVVSNAAIPNFGSPTQMIIGRVGHMTGFWSPQYMDDLSISNSSADSFPPPVSSTHVGPYNNIQSYQSIQSYNTIQSYGNINPY